MDSRMPKPAPVRAYHLKLDIGADNLKALIAALDSIQMGFHLETIGEGNGACGGPDCGWSYELRINPEMTHERYFEELQKWLDARKEGVSDES